MLTTKQKCIKNEKGSIVTPQGFQVSGLHTGVKRKRNDLGMIYSVQPANAAAVYTTNAIQAAPLLVTKTSIAKEGKLQAVIVNSGNANACTGDQGMHDALDMQKMVADKWKLKNHYVAVASTGIIGLHMDMDKIGSGIAKLQPGTRATDAASFNESILTTDLQSKSTCYETIIDGKKITMAGSAKGSGMIEPNMATMLGFITTDIAIDQQVLQETLQEITEKTFNCITVDGDTSTNDMVLVMANGMAENNPLTKAHPDWDAFVAMLESTCEDMAKMIAKDGEGATKLIEVEVHGATDSEDARKVAKSVVGSSLVKTAVFGSDANWGRIIAAIGYSGATIDVHKIDAAIGHITLLHQSQPVAFSESEASAYLEQEHIKIDIDLHMGDGTGKAWGCDLTYDYVRINASYRS
ncbi:bifunctional ornithine acetyltransferase/N-acetylglutamate synthase [Ornithinibacillus gellani]|uniref:bifunctional ornithine acetyltransferase/N-acetylglutamate synthase n=1 Tax=Ornithinibacillus gellani TaxID=2293253 RepID=UPI000F4976C0|nr:bifunctional ornithine acetyltransferase/N-acetylglutamate synthase [Ornithinibacillus gellani]TQS75770.1 bifunctional ornithine acetyltransferase/N-acetylglutamate synthase [Ornithinibacillus gellani]